MEWGVDGFALINAAQPNARPSLVACSIADVLEAGRLFTMNEPN